MTVEFFYGLFSLCEARSDSEFAEQNRRSKLFELNVRTEIVQSCFQV